MRQDEQLGDAIAKLREERERRLESIIELESRLQTVQTSLVLENVHEEQTQDNDLSLSRIQQLECRVTEFEQEVGQRYQWVPRIQIITEEWELTVTLSILLDAHAVVVINRGVW